MTNPLLDTINILRHIDSYSLQWLVNHPSIHCDDLSRALFSARRDLQLYVLVCLNRIRRPVVGEPVERHLGWMKVGSEKALRRQEEASGKVGRKVASIIQQLASQNGISIMDTPLLTAEVADRLPQNWREIPIPKAGYLPDKQQFCLESAMPGDKTSLPVPDFDLRNACQEELIRFGYRLAWGVRVDGPAMLDAIHAHISDPFSRMCLDLIQGDMDDAQIAEICTRKREVILADLRRKLDLARVGFAALTDYQQGLRMAEILQPFCPEVPLAQREPDEAVLALPLHRMSIVQLAGWFLFMARDAAAHGMLHLEQHLDHIADPWLNKAIGHFVDGCDPSLQGQMLALRADSMLWVEERKLRMIQALMNGLRREVSPRMLAHELVAYLPEMPSLEEVLARSV